MYKIHLHVSALCDLYSLEDLLTFVFQNIAKHYVVYNRVIMKNDM